MQHRETPFFGYALNQRRKVVVRYFAAVLLSALALSTRFWLYPVVGTRAPFVTFYVAVVLAASLLGVGPAVVVAIAGALCAVYFFVEPIGAFYVSDAADIVWLALYLFITGTIITALELQRRAKSRLQIETRERQRAQAEEAELREWYETTLRSIGDAVIVTDREGRVTLLNHVAESITGWPSQEAAGHPIGDIFVIHNDETGCEVESPVDRVLRDGTVCTRANHTVLTNRAGLPTAIEDTAAPIRLRSGELAGVVLIFRDVSERRRSELALQRTIADMEQFAYIGSHDLQEPLRTISSFATLLERRRSSSLDETDGEYLNFILTARNGCNS